VSNKDKSMEVWFLPLYVMFVERSTSALSNTYVQRISPIFNIQWAMNRTIRYDKPFLSFFLFPLFGYYWLLPSKSLQAVTFLTYTREVPCANFGWGTDYSDIFRGFTQSLQANAEILPYVMPRPLPSIHVLVHYSLLIQSFDAVLFSLTYWQGNCKYTPRHVITVEACWDWELIIHAVGLQISSWLRPISALDRTMHTHIHI
jgi:hypothetical protein